MLNRRYIRIKVLQALYAFFFSDSTDVKAAENALVESNKRVYELYIWIISIYAELRDIAQEVIDDNKQKMLPSEDDLNPSLRFVENPFIIALIEDKEFLANCNTFKINWKNNKDILKKIYSHLRSSEYFINYLNKTSVKDEEHLDILVFILQEFIESNDVLQNAFEEIYIHWAEDYYYACSCVDKTLKSTYTSGRIEILPLYKDAEEDLDFLKRLFRKSILNRKEFEALISEKADNWEFDRIASMDLILINMAITEILEFSSIPIKASLNEYIEMSKMYSSPKSKLFVNGVLDKIVQQYKEEGKIKKIGRGLLE